MLLLLVRRLAPLRRLRLASTCVGLIAALGSSGLAAPLFDEPVDLTLRDGRILRAAQAKAFATTTVMIKHADGAITVPYDQFPEPYREKLLRKRPAPRREAQAAADRPKAPAAAPKPPPPGSIKSFHGLLLDGARPHGQFAEVSVRNLSGTAQHCSPNFFVAETDSGQFVTGVDFVGLSSEGKVAAVLKRDQVIERGDSATFTVVFRRPSPPEPGEFRNIDWRQ